VEIAGLLRIPAGSVATALHRGRERLREMIEGKETHELR
jgi:DNA-directed RNA polymerase specialized sigma24 family protein